MELEGEESVDGKSLIGRERERERERERHSQSIIK